MWNFDEIYNKTECIEQKRKITKYKRNDRYSDVGILQNNKIHMNSYT